MTHNHSVNPDARGSTARHLASGARAGYWEL